MSPARTPRFDPASYPGRRPAGPVVVTRTRERALAPAALPELLAERPQLRWVVAYGANADPDRLRDKGLTGTGAVLLPAELEGWVAAFEARRTGYGAVPLTLVPRQGAVMATWVLGIPDHCTPQLDRTEGRAPGGAPARRDPGAGSARHAPPGTYQLARVGPVTVAGAYRLEDALAYVPGPGTRVQIEDGRWRTWPEHDQRSARRHLEVGGPSAPAPPVVAPVLGDWPADRLVALADDGGSPPAPPQGRSIAGWSRAAGPRR